MNCDEVKLLQGPHLDSELDAKTTLEVEQHLKSCPECARFFAAEQKLGNQLKAGLNQGHRTAALWERIEEAAVAAAPSILRSRPSPRLLQAAGWHVIVAALGRQLKVGWQRSPKTWTGLAAAWVVIFALDYTAREPDAQLVAGKQLPPTAEMRFALKQNQLLMAELAVTAEPAPADKPKPAPPSPRSDRRMEALNA